MKKRGTSSTNKDDVMKSLTSKSNISVDLSKINSEFSNNNVNSKNIIRSEIREEIKKENNDNINNNAKNDKYWYLRTVKEVFDETKSSMSGLNDYEAQERLKLYGKNIITKKKKISWPLRILKEFNSLLIYILLGSAIISYISDHVVETIVIGVIIFFTVFLGILQEYRAEKSVEALAKLTTKSVKVIRNGKIQELLSENLVPGDLIILKRGMIVPADLRVVECKGLGTDESILTGESIIKIKHDNPLDKQDVSIADQNNMVFSGTSITRGDALGIVVETGFNSELGKISSKLASIKEKKSPLQRKIESMGQKISYIVLIVCAIVFVYLALKKVPFFDALLLVGVLAVSGIPESFPLTMTLALSSGVKRMAKHNAIVKDLSSVETLGTTTVICTDKTGTLTENKMKVERFYTSENYRVEGSGYDPISDIYLGSKKVFDKDFKKNSKFFETMILCNNAELEKQYGDWILVGEPTEGALLSLAKSVGFDDEVLRENNKRVHEIPFDPMNKFMVSVNKNRKNKQTTAYMKGAIETILSKCSYIRRDDSVEKLSRSKIAKLEKIIGEYGDAGLRVLGIATKKVTKIHDKLLENEYIFEGFVGIEDPIRPEVFDAIRLCKTSGIRIIMVTGDHKKTAMSIASKLGLLDSHRNKIVEGRELNEMSDEDLDRIIDDVAVFARTTPEHKYMIVKCLQRKGEIVAMTGDGVNDAPSLKKADIGVSMGKNGTEVAREASNMILTDDKFSTIVNAVKEGRTIYSNIRRFIYYLLAGNFSEVSLMVTSIFMGILTPLTPIMILFVNIVTSTIPSVALSVEPTHDKVMKQRPRHPKEKLLSSYILLKILVLVPIITIGTLYLFLQELNTTGDYTKASTIAFTTIILFELIHTLNAKSLSTTIFKKDIFSNKFLYLAGLLSLALTVFIIYFKPLQTIFKLAPLGLFDWIRIIAVSSTVLIISEIIKLLIRSEFSEQGFVRGIDLKME